MSSPLASSLRAVLLSLVLAVAVSPSAAFAQSNPIDRSADFVKGGAVIENLTAVQFSGIVVIRGRTGERNRAEEASRIATSLGYLRVANLILVVDESSADAAIINMWRRRLELEPALDGCRFRVDSSRGVIQLTGQVHRQAQADLAVEILSRIDGVKVIHPNLTRL